MYRAVHSLSAVLVGCTFPNVRIVAAFQDLGLSVLMTCDDSDDIGEGNVSHCAKV